MALLMGKHWYGASGVVMASQHFDFAKRQVMYTTCLIKSIATMKSRLLNTWSIGSGIDVF